VDHRVSILVTEELRQLAPQKQIFEVSLEPVVEIAPATAIRTSKLADVVVDETPGPAAAAPDVVDGALRRESAHHRP
jgi:hypothetical protein